MNELDLVLRYAPVLLFSKDDRDREEDFFPISTAHYVAEASLYKKGEGVVKERTMLSLDDLAAMTPSRSHDYYLTFAADEILEHDLTDAMQLPNDVHKTALERYKQYRDFSRYPPVFYYSALNSRGYLALQYWFFYAYNDWGTGHGGVNDHEGDWEMIALFLRDNKPQYIAYSAHTGTPEHHCWDASEVQKADGTHPVVYVGCGSHANYFHSKVHDMFGYADYAFGNSAVSIGPGTDLPWAKPINLGTQSWALNYAGGWGAMVKRFRSTSLAPGALSPVGPPWQFKRWESPAGWAKVPLP